MAALDESEALAAAPIPCEPEDRGAWVLAAKVAEIAAAHAAAGVAAALVANIDAEMEDLDAAIDILRNMLGLPGEGRKKTTKTIASPTNSMTGAAATARLGPADDYPLDYWSVLAKYDLMTPEWWAIHDY